MELHKAHSNTKTPLIGQFHDEIILDIREENQTYWSEILKKAIYYTNKQLKLNRDLDIDIQFGENYYLIH